MKGDEFRNSHSGASLSLREAHVAVQIGYFDDLALVEWVRSTSALDEHFDEPSAAELLSINTKNPTQLESATNLFFALSAKLHPEFEQHVEESEQIAKRLFRNRINECLAGERKIWEACQMVQFIEGWFDFPNWLGDMYNVCDWLDPGQEMDSGFDQAFREQLALMDEDVD